MSNIITDTETIISVDMNFSNGGGSHTASIQTVLKAKDISNEEDELGSLIGGNGGRTTFSNSDLQKLMLNFIMVEKTDQKNGRQRTISRSYEDITSLKLKSHCFLVRGMNSHPHDKGFGGLPSGATQISTEGGAQYNGLGSTETQYLSSSGGSYVTMPYFGELPNSPITNSEQRFPFKQPRKNGGVILIGNIYNEESSVSSSGTKISLVYQTKTLQENLSYLEGDGTGSPVSTFYKKNPDLANYNLKYGYTLAEAKKGFAQAGINIIGLPESTTNKVLFTESGTLDSILSTIASKYGYYWFVNPFRPGVIQFVSSSSASNLSVTNPLKQSGSIQSKYLNASFTENFLNPKVVNGFSSTIEKQEQTFEFSDSNKFTRFHKVDVNPFLKDLGISESLYAVFYGAFLAGKLDANSFDVIAYIATHFVAKGRPLKLDWGEDWSDADEVPGGSLLEWEKVAGLGQTQTLMEDASESDFDLGKGRFLRLRNVNNGNPPQRPSKSKAYILIKDVFNVITNSIYCSNKMRSYRAKRTQWNNSDMNISGPFQLEQPEPEAGEQKADDVLIKDVDALQDLLSFIERHKTGSGVAAAEKLKFLFEKSNSSGGGSYGFIGRVSNNQKHLVGRGKDELDYDLLNDKNYEFVKNPQTNTTYLGISEKLEKKIEELIIASQGIWADMMKGDHESTPNTMKAFFTRSKTPTDLLDSEESRKDEEAKARRQDNLDALAEKIQEVSERFDIRYYSLKSNGASGNSLFPISLDLKDGTISDILSLEASNISTRASRGQNLQNSSRTIVGLSIPTSFKITLSGISIKLGSAGVTTTINESTLKLLPPDEQIIIDSNSKSNRSLSPLNRLKASQKNFLGL
jgi:hypothetical protein